jgi:hypothetical protein
VQKRNEAIYDFLQDFCKSFRSSPPFSKAKDDAQNQIDSSAIMQRSTHALISRKEKKIIHVNGLLPEISVA